MSPDDYWRKRPVARALVLGLALVVIGAPLLFTVVYRGETRALAVLRERAGLSDTDRLDIIKAGALVRADGAADHRKILWCGWVNDDPARGVAALESRGRGGAIQFVDSALGWAPRSDRERLMIAQCERTAGGATTTGGAGS